VEHAHAVVAFVTFQVSWGLAAGLVEGVHDSEPAFLSATEKYLRRSRVGLLATYSVLVGFVLGIVLLVRLIGPLGWGLAIGTLVGSWLLAFLLQGCLLGLLPRRLGGTLPGLIALLLMPCLALWAWLA
jgi:hypothetical protein